MIVFILASLMSFSRTKNDIDRRLAAPTPKPVRPFCAIFKK
jgi:hypothetical protein